MAMILAANLIAKFKYAYDNKWGYIINTAGILWTAERQAKVTDTYAKKYGSKWIGHYVADCSGLFSWAFNSIGGFMYHGSNTMWNKYCTSQGKLKSGKRIDGQTLKPGTAVFKLVNGNDRSHVGLYIGNGEVIEASSTESGVIKTKITNSKWSEWGELKGVDYSTSSSQQEESSSNTISVGSAVVNAVKVALRAGPSTNDKVLTRVDKCLDTSSKEFFFISNNFNLSFIRVNVFKFLVKIGQKLPIKEKLDI